MANIDNDFARSWLNLAGQYARQARRLYHNIKALDRYYLDNVGSTGGPFDGAANTDIVLRQREKQGVPNPTVQECLAARGTLNQIADLADEAGNQITVLTNFDVRLSRVDPSNRIAD